MIFLATTSVFTLLNPKASRSSYLLPHVYLRRRTMVVLVTLAFHSPMLHKLKSNQTRLPACNRASCYLVVNMRLFELAITQQDAEANCS